MAARFDAPNPIGKLSPMPTRPDTFSVTPDDTLLQQGRLPDWQGNIAWAGAAK
jgi:hypothetical protein